jgi:GAF domain-containing protein
MIGDRAIIRLRRYTAWVLDRHDVKRPSRTGHLTSKERKMSESSEPGLAFAFARLLHLLIDAADLDAFLAEMADLAATVIVPGAACGLTMHRDGRPYTASAAGDPAGTVDEIQYRTGEGPCLESLDTGQVVQVDDLSTDLRWERFRPLALAEGVASSLSLPLAVDGQTIGSINLYARKPQAFHGMARQHAEAFTALCTSALALSMRQMSQVELHAQLTEAMASRSIIDQAIGILMGQQRCTAVEAFDLLRQASQHRNRRLRDVATDIVTGIAGKLPEQGGTFRSGPGGKGRKR